MRTYISGPITGHADLNRPAFDAAADKMRGLGRTPVIPHDVHPSLDKTWAEYLRADIAALVQCQAIHMLPGWRQSKGARLEHHISDELDMCITFEPGAER